MNPLSIIAGTLRTVFALRGRQSQYLLVSRITLTLLSSQTENTSGQFPIGENSNLSQPWWQENTQLSPTYNPGKKFRERDSWKKHTCLRPKHVKLGKTLARSSFGLKVLYTQRLKHKCLKRALLSASVPTI